MPRPFKPMLADHADFSMLRFPLLASLKLDGIRATIHDGLAYSRSMKPLPNRWLQYCIGQMPELEGVDGEFVVGPQNARDVFRVTTSHVMSDEKMNFRWHFHCFDRHDMPGIPYEERLQALQQTVGSGIGREGAGAFVMLQSPIEDLADLDFFEAQALDLGYEGVMVRDPGGFYKQGRSTANGQELNKVKRSADMEAVVIGSEELLHNANERFVNEIGRGQRSSAKAGKVGLKALGALTVIGAPGSPFEGEEFNVGGGFDAKERIDLWLVRETLIGRIVKVKHFPIGAADKPRHPIFLGWRDARDMG